MCKKKAYLGTRYRVVLDQVARTQAAKMNRRSGLAMNIPEQVYIYKCCAYVE